MADSDDKGFFDRLGAILNTPLPGTRPTPAPPSAQTDPADVDDSGILERIRDILSAPLPGTVPAENVPAGGATGDRPLPHSAPATPAIRPSEPAGGQLKPAASDLSEAALNEDWWRRDWEGFKTHQTQEGRGLELKQARDRETLAAFQAEEQRRFAAHQQHEAAVFRQHQQWKLDVWRQYQDALRAGRQVPPPPFALPPDEQARLSMPPGMMPEGPPGATPPWLRRPR
jgi:hypothetical protein